MENNILKQIQQNLDALQKQIDGMKPQNNIPAAPQASGYGALYYRFKEKADALTRTMRELAGESGVCVSGVFSASGSEHGGIGEAVYYSLRDISEIDEIDENKISSAVEAFSSPKRINILKALMSKKFMSSNELTMKTGCIGGQLYHHLSILEAAKIICKTNELYTLTDSGRNLTNIIFCIAFGKPV
ncbi:MAG: ArsR family transcriptional regulator [Oscillospiraceae bacterium]|nr:ArsR family transcriptional regulator [Oscillospiraceae bacterium]